jgi:predicted nucleic acid-binding protein
MASRRWGLCGVCAAQRRPASGGGSPKRLLIDFVVAAHALLRADQLMTLDPSRYKLDFPKLHLV